MCGEKNSAAAAAVPVLDAVFMEQLTALVHRAGALLFDELLLADSSAKGRGNFVTRCDLAVEQFLSRELPLCWPGIPLLGEEEEDKRPPLAGPVWILDPVDGTANLMHHFQHSAISLALTVDGQPVAGVVYDPFLKETFTALRGQGAFCNGRPLRASGESSLPDSVVIVGTALYDRRLTDANFALFRRLFDRCGDLRRTGTASLDLCYVAAGRAEGYLERDLKPWDIAAGVLLVQEAGGRVTGFTGAPLDLSRNNNVLAAAALYPQLAQLAAENVRQFGGLSGNE